MANSQTASASQRKGALDRPRVIKVEPWHDEALAIAKAIRCENLTCTKIAIAHSIRHQVHGVPLAATIVRWLGEKEDTGELFIPINSRSAVPVDTT